MSKAVVTDLARDPRPRWAFGTCDGRTVLFFNSALLHRRLAEERHWIQRVLPLMSVSDALRR